MKGRYKASLVDSESYVLHCHRYIDLSPFRARMTVERAASSWPRCASQRDHRSDAILAANSAYIAIGSTHEARATAYQQALRETLSDDDLKVIRAHFKQPCASGRDNLRAMVEANTRRFAEARPSPTEKHFKRL